MKSLFPMGRLRPCPCVLERIPRPAFVAAMVRHFTTEHAGERRTLADHEGVAFELVTEGDETHVRLV